MPKRVRPYGSAADAESAGLARGRPRAGGELVSELASTMMMRDIANQAAEATRALRDLTSDGTGFGSLEDARDVIASLERMGQARSRRALARIPTSGSSRWSRLWRLRARPLT
jgi:hypothetical protein